MNLLAAVDPSAFGTSDALTALVGLGVGIIGWSLKRNIGDLDAKLSTLLTSIKELTDHKAETREALVELRLRITSLERGRHQTGEHEVAR